MSDYSEAHRKMARRDWHLRLTVEEADAVRQALDAGETNIARLTYAVEDWTMQLDTWIAAPQSRSSAKAEETLMMISAALRVAAQRARKGTTA